MKREAGDLENKLWYARGSWEYWALTPKETDLMALVPCPFCSAQISDKAKKCPKCNALIASKKTFNCPECRNIQEEGAKSCTECGMLFTGSELEASASSEQKINQQHDGGNYKCKWCGFHDNKYSEYCPNCKLDSKGVLKPGVYQCKWCGFRSEEYSAACPKCNRDHVGNSRTFSAQPGPSLVLPVAKSKSRTGLVISLIVLLFLSIGVIILLNNGRTLNSLINTPATYQISASCSSVTGLLITAQTSVTVTNSSQNSFTNVTVTVVSYDSNQNQIEQKKVSFDRTLGPYGTLTKAVFVPARTSYCTANVENATSN